MRTGSSQEADASSVLLTEDSQEKLDTLMLMLTEKLSQSISNQDTKLGLDTALVLNLLKLLIISALHLSNIIKSAMMVMELMEPQLLQLAHQSLHQHQLKRPFLSLMRKCLLSMKEPTCMDLVEAE